MLNLTIFNNNKNLVALQSLFNTISVDKGKNPEAIFSQTLKTHMWGMITY